MSQPIISLEGLGKRFIVGRSAEPRERYTALRDVIASRARQTAHAALNLARGKPRRDEAPTEEFWALKDVSFDVREGQVMGIVGRNGAGKSTLLKILSRITDPTEGRAVLRGRVASLLEVGTGFHPELTGRENIYLNGAMLGMKRAEIVAKFDEIVAFSEVERFLDTPVKRYSSGMYVRLAFAVAAHLEPEILVVDEVLAVGDAEFQRKCLGKMHDVASKEGRTVLFVSHNMAAVERLCDTAVLLANGRVVTQGPTADVVHEYLLESSRAAAIPLAERTDREGSGDLRVLSMALKGRGGQIVSAFRSGETATLSFEVENKTNEPLSRFRFAVRIDSDIGQRVGLLDSWLLDQDVAALAAGRSTVDLVMPKLMLVPGRYKVTLWSSVGDGSVADWLKDAATFDVEAGDYYGTGRLPDNGVTSLIDHRVMVGPA
jgi:lipopolysaccharide transport system ATP-binding protein